MQTVENAQAVILSTVPCLGSEDLFLVEAVNRVLAREVVSQRNIPPFDNSAMDGYAVRASDIQKASSTDGVSLEIVGKSLAGGDGHEAAKLQGGQAMQIATGAQVPPGADCVVMRENTDEKDVGDGSGSVRILKAEPVGCAIRRRGEDVLAGAAVIHPGDILTPARINLAAQSGHAIVACSRKPQVAILSSGDELVEVGQAATDRDIVNSNAHSLAALVRAAGGEPHLLGIASDTLEDHVAKIRGGGFADILLTIGGVSMGVADFVRPAFKELGAELSFWKVAMRPGKPLTFGTCQGQVVFGLPGNPVSSQVSFELFVRPAIRKMLGLKTILRQSVQAKLVSEGMSKRPGVAFYARAQIRLTKEGFTASIGNKQSSGQISGLANANGLVVIDADREKVTRGDIVPALLLDDTAFFSAA